MITCNECSKEAIFSTNTKIIESVNPGLIKSRKGGMRNWKVENISNLINSIKEIGLLNPILVLKSNRKFTLLDGEARLCAWKHSFGNKPIATIRGERMFFCLRCSKKNLLKYDFFTKLKG